MEFVLLVSLFLLVIGIFELYPIKVLKVESCPPLEEKNLSPQKGQKSFVVHVHSCFSYDSLGKPEQIEYSAQKLGIRAVFVTDHDNDLIRFVPSSLIRAGKEFQHPQYGRLLTLPLKGKTLYVIAHPNNRKKPLYQWRGNYKPDFLYELIDLKDVITEAPKMLKVYFLLRSLVLYPFKGFRVGDYFPKLIPIKDWVKIYLQRTKGELKTIGGLDHHIKFSFWEKAKKNFSFPPYEVSFYILQNRTWEEDLDQALLEGKFYLSLCGFSLYVQGKEIKTCHPKVIFEHYTTDGKVFYTERGCIESNKTRFVVVYKYLFRLGNIYFGLQPMAVIDSFLLED
ncbi:MAG: hypothetical protein GXN97_06440 [Aquificae bacterium]|nr:hypothetical protein [Aquificota bacterium]